MPSLEDLEIRNVRGGDAAALGHVAAIPNLRRLEFQDAKLTEVGARNFERMRNLEVLQLTSSQMPDAALAHLKSRLKNLNLWRVPVTDEGLGHLRAQTDLEELHLTDTKITDAGLVHLQNLNRLQILGLSGTRVTDAGLETLARLPALRRLSLVKTEVTYEGVARLKERVKDSTCTTSRRHGPCHAFYFVRRLFVGPTMPCFDLLEDGLDGIGLAALDGLKLAFLASRLWVRHGADEMEAALRLLEAIKRRTHLFQALTGRGPVRH